MEASYSGQRSSILGPLPMESPVYCLDFSYPFFGDCSEAVEVVGVLEEGKAKRVVFSGDNGACVHAVKKPDFTVYDAVPEILNPIKRLNRLIHVIEKEGHVMLLAVIVSCGAVDVDYYAKVGVVKAAEIVVVVTSGPGIEVDFGFH